MRVKYIHRAAFVAGLLLASATLDSFAQPTPGQTASVPVAKPLPFVSPIFGDNMVLQRGGLDPIWGWSDPGDTVRVQVGSNTATGTAGPDRRWMVRIQPPAIGGPYTLAITGHQTVELHNILIGDVWLCGGQSNMGLPLKFAKNADEEIKAANHPEIRFFNVQGHPAYRRVDFIEGN
jgi:sialate O-acetylesterase